MIRSAKVGAAIALAVAAACTPIEPAPLTSAPKNECPCDDYAPGVRSGAKCSSLGRCEIATPGNRPEFPFFVVASVPDAAVYAPGATFVFYSDEKGTPAFTKSPVALQRCIAPKCLQLSGFSLANGHYRVSAEASLLARYPLADGVSIPTRVAYEPIGNIADATGAQPDFPKALPVSPSVVFPRLGTDGPEFVSALPFGRYRRIMYPEPPFDALFPPRTEAAQEVKSNPFPDNFLLDASTLDLPTNTNRVDVARVAGLDGFSAWFADGRSNRRISTLRALTGRDVTVRLDTTGQDELFKSSDLQFVLAPPKSSLAVPTFVTNVFSGQVGKIVYPSIPLPVPVTGVVAEPSTGRQLFGYAARLTFESINISTLPDTNTSSVLLHYTTNLSTDDRGQFATVLPPGEYMVTIEPAEGTGFAKVRQFVVVDPTVTVTALTLQPPKRTVVRGRVLLSDQRPLADAEILATPQTPSSSQPKPRPTRTRTQPDGRFELELDQGPYVLTAVPKLGSGFPRVVTRSEIPAVSADLPDILVPAPTPLSFTIRDPIRPSENPVANVIVRIFAVPGAKTTEDMTSPTAPEPVEIGDGMTDTNGFVEILLAPGPT